MLLCLAVFGILKPAYVSLENLYSFLLSASLPAVLASGMGHTAGFSALMCGYSLRTTGIEALPSMVLAVLLAVAIGAINGFLVSRIGISSFIVTLGMQFVLVGVRQWITAGNSYRANSLIKSIAQGIGACIASAFAELGAEVGIVDIKLEKAKETAKAIAEKTGGKVKAYACDVTKMDQAETMVTAFIADFGGIDYAVNNAGIFTGEGILEINQKQFESVINVNLNGVFYTAQAAAKRMVTHKTGGSIVSTASMSGHIVNRPQTIANYCASKAGVIHLSKALAVELAPHHIRVNTISPGYMQTDLIASLKDMLPIWSDMMPEGSRLGYPENLIGAYVYFVSDASLYTTGADLVVDGGYTIV